MDYTSQFCCCMAIFIEYLFKKINEFLSPREGRFAQLYCWGLLCDYGQIRSGNQCAFTGVTPVENREYLIFQIKVRRFVETSVNTYPKTKRHIPEYFNFQILVELSGIVDVPLNDFIQEQCHLKQQHNSYISKFFRVTENCPQNLDAALNKD